MHTSFPFSCSFSKSIYIKCKLLSGNPYVVGMSESVPKNQVVVWWSLAYSKNVFIAFLLHGIERHVFHSASYPPQTPWLEM